MINCIIVDDEPTALDILEIHLQKVDSIQLVARCSSAMEAFNVINQHEVDLLFLDINMPEISGLSFAQSINKDIKVIFTTAYRQYAVEGFDLQAVDYLLKPISPERLLQAINKYKSEKQPTPEISVSAVVSDHIFVKSDRKMVKIDLSEICYIESLSDYLKIHLRDKTIVTRETITNIESRIPESEFLRIHRSYIISIPMIESYTNEFVEINGKALPISRSHKKEVLRKLESPFH